MFDFIYSEAWRMDTLATTIIAAAAGIIAAIITAVASNKKVDKNLSLHDKNLSIHDKNTEKNKELLSKEHSDIRKDVCAAAASTEKEVGEVRTVLSSLKDRMIEAETEKRVRLQNLDEAQKKLCSSAENMGKFADEFMRIVTENKQLREENALLKDRISKLVQRLENEHMQRDNSREDNEMEIG